MAKKKTENEETKKPRKRNVDKFVNFRKQFGLRSITEMAEDIEVDYQKLLRLSKIGNDILTPKYRVLGSEKTFYHKDDTKAIAKEVRRLTGSGGEGLTQNDMAKELGLHPSFFGKAVSLNPELKPENGEFYTKAEKARIIKLMIIKPEPPKEPESENPEE